MSNRAPDLAEFVSDYFQICDHAPTNKEIAEAYLDQYSLDDETSFRDQVKQLAPQIAYYTGRES